MTYELKHKILVDYLTSKVDEADWHGVCDAANDLRVMEAEKRARDEMIKLEKDTRAYQSGQGNWPQNLPHALNCPCIVCRSPNEIPNQAGSQQTQQGAYTSYSNAQQPNEHRLSAALAAEVLNGPLTGDKSPIDPYRFVPDKLV